MIFFNQPTYGDNDLTALLRLFSIIKEQDDNPDVSECEHHEEIIITDWSTKQS